MLGEFVVYYKVHLCHETGKNLYLPGKRGGKHTTLILSRLQSGRTSRANLRASENATLGLEENVLMCSANPGRCVNWNGEFLSGGHREVLAVSLPYLERLE